VRVLVVAPFPLQIAGRHGGTRAVAQLVARLADRHTVALLVLKGEGEPDVDDRLRHLCDLVEEVGIPAVGTSIASRQVRCMPPPSWVVMVVPLGCADPPAGFAVSPPGAAWGTR